MPNSKTANLPATSSRLQCFNLDVVKSSADCSVDTRERERSSMPSMCSVQSRVGALHACGRDNWKCSRVKKAHEVPRPPANRQLCLSPAASTYCQLQLDLMAATRALFLQCALVCMKFEGKPLGLTSCAHESA
eukprot:4592016-Amphidinium_carterae.1